MATFLTPSDGDYYLLPRKLERDTLTEPYNFAQEGVPTLLTSVSTVVFDDGKVKAVTTSDISLASL